MSNGRVLRVLMLVDKFDYHGSYINGPARYFSWVAERLDRKRFQPVVCALRRRGKSDVLFRERNIDVIYLGLGRFNPFALTKIIGVIRKHRIDLLHLTGYAAMTFGRVAGAICRKPTVIQEHWVDPGMGRMHSFFERCMGIFPSYGIAISEYSRRFLVEKKGMAANRITVIANGIPLGEFRDVPDGVGVRKREELGIPPGAAAIGMVGMLHENKGHRFFLEAARIVSAKRHDAMFLIVGDGELREELEQLVIETSLKNVVRFLGHQREIPAILQMLDVWVMASLSETAPLSLLEAMAARKAIVITDCGGPSEIIRDGQNGVVVPPRDAPALAHAIEGMIDDPGTRLALGQNAGRESERFDIETAVTRLEQFYATTVAGQARSRSVRTVG